MKIEVLIDDLVDGSIIELLQSHFWEMHKYSPPESIHAFDPEEIKHLSVTFWAARNKGELLGCGALKALSTHSAEIKSMKTKSTYLRMGVGKKILQEILMEAKSRHYTSVSLETGSNDAFKPAIEMYKKYGFIECGPFGNYKADPYSKFFTKTLTD